MNYKTLECMDFNGKQSEIYRQNAASCCAGPDDTKNNNEVSGWFDFDLNKWVVSGFGMEAVDRSVHKAVAILMRMRVEL